MCLNPGEEDAQSLFASTLWENVDALATNRTVRRGQETRPAAIGYVSCRLSFHHGAPGLGTMHLLAVERCSIYAQVQLRT